MTGAGPLFLSVCPLLRSNMPVPSGVGVGVGDFVAVGTLAWNVYKAAKGAPEAFNQIHDDMLSLHVVLKEAEETVGKSPLDREG